MAFLLWPDWELKPRPPDLQPEIQPIVPFAIPMSFGNSLLHGFLPGKKKLLSFGTCAKGAKAYFDH
jgi:hypothetical protein